jgi:hypothetical protein
MQTFTNGKYMDTYKRLLFIILVSWNSNQLLKVKKCNIELQCLQLMFLVVKYMTKIAHKVGKRNYLFKVSFIL